MIVSGPSKAGKTVFVTKLVKHCREIFEQLPTQILWCYAEYQPGYNELALIPNLRFIEGIPDLTLL